ncbi:peptidase M19 [Candidatus Magnetomorum sp. HK-1]|nr:peptidase M19 [Candidatus Magnetomorum sp. HK-1]
MDILFDGHVDLSSYVFERHPGILLNNLQDSHISLDTFKKANLRLFVSSFFCPDTFNGQPFSFSYLKCLIEYWKVYCAKNFVYINNVDTLNKCIDEELIGCICLLENAEALLWLDDLYWLKKENFKVIGLTHIGANGLGSGNEIYDNSGFSTAGKDIIRKIQDNDFVIDTAHLSERCFWELMDIYNGDIICSHTGFRKFCDKQRNLSNQQIDIIIEKKSVIGFSFHSSMIGKQVFNVDEVFLQIDWFAQKYGIDNLAIGSDLGGFGNIFPSHDFVISDWIYDLKNLMIKKAYKEQDINKILYDNWISFYKTVL